MSLCIKQKQQWRKRPGAKRVKTIHSRLLFCCMLGCVFFFRIIAAVTSFSTLYFSYVSHPCNFIGQSPRVIHRVKWRGRRTRLATGLALVYESESETPRARKELQHARCVSSVTLNINSKECTSIQWNNYLRNCADWYLRHSLYALSLHKRFTVDSTCRLTVTVAMFAF